MQSPWDSEIRTTLSLRESTSFKKQFLGWGKALEPGSLSGSHVIVSWHILPITKLTVPMATHHMVEKHIWSQAQTGSEGTWEWPRLPCHYPYTITPLKLTPMVPGYGTDKTSQAGFADGLAQGAHTDRTWTFATLNEHREGLSTR